MFYGVMLALVIALSDPFGGPQARSAGQQKPAPKKSAAPAAARMSDALVAAIQDLAKDKSSYEFLALADYAEGSMKLSVNSNRTMIAWQTAKALESGGRYRVQTALERLDLVTVDCGDSDLGDIFECSRVRVLGPEKQVIKPISYTAGANSYRNALGARWRVREVLAMYDARLLRDGFSVEYADFGGTEWTFPVLPDDARGKLLLQLAVSK